jgi:hypothetical protein
VSLGHRGPLLHFMATDSGHLDPTDERAFVDIVCGHCDRVVSAAVIASTGTNLGISWLRCTGCSKGLVLGLDGVLLPGVRPGESVEGLPPDTAGAYAEARAAASVGAYTACELMCRKILMHVAVDKGAKPGQNFVTYVDHLEKPGYLTPPMKPWVDLIRKRANIATHELPATDQKHAIMTLEFTAQLLRLVYEMSYLVSMYASDNDTSTDTTLVSEGSDDTPGD